MKYAILAAYGLSILAANVTLAYVGLIPVWPGVMAPAGVLWAGVALTLRDLVRESWGPLPAIGAVVAGAALSWLFAPSFALASGVAFLVSELADAVVYEPIRKRAWLWAIVLSNTVGLVVDSALFLWLAFGSLEFMLGQVIGKLAMTLLAVAVLWWIRRGRVVPVTAH